MAFKITKEEAEFLVELARKAVEERLINGKIINSPKDVSNNLKEPRGIFVTINSFQDGAKTLRGCIGFPFPTYPLIQAVIEAAVESSIRDPRFRPLSISELENVIFEISILTPPLLISVNSPKEYLSKIKIGEDGLIVESGLSKGLLLPQVPIEWGWNTEEFLCQCCLKAGVTPDCWLLKGTKIFKFSSIIAKELKPKGNVVVIDLREKGSDQKL
jgi:uncharacterized protein (TIGR00296 family)